MTKTTKGPANKSWLRIEKDVIERIFLNYSSAKETFKIFDTDHDAKITQEEFFKGVQDIIEYTLQPKQLEALWARVDNDKSGSIVMSEFIERYRLSLSFEKVLGEKYNISALHQDSINALQALLAHVMEGENGLLQSMFAEGGTVTKSQFKAGLQQVYDEAKSQDEAGQWAHLTKNHGITEKDVDALFSMIDDKEGSIDLHEFKRMLKVVPKDDKPAESRKRYAWKLDLPSKKLRFQNFPENFSWKQKATKQRLAADAANDVLRCSDLNGCAEYILKAHFEENHPHLVFQNINDNSNSTSNSKLVGKLGRVVDFTNEEPTKGPALFMTFYVCFYGEEYQVSLYHGRVQFNLKNEVVSFEVKTVQTKLDYEVQSEETKLVFADWPERHLQDEGWIDMSEAEYKQVTAMEEGANREEFLVDKFFKSKFPPIQIAKPAFTVLALKRQFDLLDKNGSGELSLGELTRAMEECQMSKKKAEAHAKGFFKLADKDEGATICIHEFLQEYIRMQSYKALRSVHSAFDQADSDGDGSLSKTELLAVLAEQLGDDEAAIQIDKVFKTIDQDEDGEISLKELAVWYFAMEAKSRMRQKMNKLRRRQKRDKNNHIVKKTKVMTF